MNAMSWIQGTAAAGTVECKGCEDCDGEGGHAVVAQATESGVDLARVEMEENEREDRKAAEAASDEVGAAKFTDVAKAVRFLLAGNARVTLVSKKTGTRFTYRVRSKKVDAGAQSIHFVGVLTGSNNETDFEFLGTIFGGTTFVHGRKSRIGSEAPSSLAFGWTVRHMLAGKFPEKLEVHHEGRCGKCGRALTVPESIETGLGPVCAKGGRDR